MIAEPEQMLEVVDLLRHCDKDDVIEIIISTPGGSVPTMVDLLTAMDECIAPITTIANGVVASCGFIIWSYGDIIKCRDHAICMAHGPSHMSWGKSLDVIDYSEGVIDNLKNLLSVSINKGILTEQEYDNLINKRMDVYLFKETLQPRLDKYNNGEIDYDDGNKNDLKKVLPPPPKKEGDDN